MPRLHTVLRVVFSVLLAAILGLGPTLRLSAGGWWVAVNTGLTNPYVWALAIDPQTPSRLYAGTWGGGVFVLRCPLYWVFLPLMLRNR